MPQSHASLCTAQLPISQTRGIMTFQNDSLWLMAWLMMLVTPDVWVTAQEKAEGLKESSYRVDASFPQQADGLYGKPHRLWP